MKKQQSVELGSDEWKTVPSRKDRTAWCGGHPQREHVPELIKASGRYSRPCGMGPSVLHPDTQVWHCRHVVACETCHKVLDTAVPQDCPDRPENR